jgi:hypothetical protein
MNRNSTFHQKAARPSLAALALLPLLGIAGSAGAQSFSYTDFSSTDGLQLLDHAAITDGHRLRLADGDQVAPPGTAFWGPAGAVWHRDKVSVQGGFETTFRFQITDLKPQPPITNIGLPPQSGGDGLAFVLQNDPISGTNAEASYGGGRLGYSSESPGAAGTPVYNAFGIEFDLWQNPEYHDPNDNHISVHYGAMKGRARNFKTKEAFDVTYCHPDERYSLGSTVSLPNMSDGATHTAKIHYTPGTLRVYLDNMTNPALVVPVDLTQQLPLDGGKAWAGITAAYGGATEKHDFLSWSFSDTAGEIPLAPAIGDANGDGTKDVSDAVEVLRYAVGVGTRSTEPPGAMDVNGDGSADVADAILVLTDLVTAR